MSQVLASTVMKPDEFPDMQVEQNVHWDFCPDLISLPKVSRLPIENEKIAKVADMRVLRSMSRAGLILCRVAMDCMDLLNDRVTLNPVRTGLYCGVDQGPIDYDLVEKISQSPEQEMGSILLRATKPKQIFKMYPNYSTNQVGIMLGVQGPMQTFTNMKFGSLHALEQAEFDLWHGAIDLAFVCSANSIEDPMVSTRVLSESPEDIILAEGGAALILAKSSTRTNWENSEMTKDKIFYGITDPLIRIACHHKDMKEIG